MLKNFLIAAILSNPSIFHFSKQYRLANCLINLQ